MQQPPKKAISGYYDGALYAGFVESVTMGLLAFVAEAVPAGSRVIDVCCGTGALAFLCAEKCDQVLGVDISPKMIAYAEARRLERGIDNLRFLAADARSLPNLRNRSFDFATLVLGLHEMPAAVRPQVLLETARVAQTLLVVDFRPRMRWNGAGIRNRLIEATAGPRHFRGFRDFSRRGGLPPLIADVGLRVQRKGLLDRGNIEIYTLGRAEHALGGAVSWLPDRGESYSFGPLPDAEI